MPIRRAEPPLPEREPSERREQIYQAAARLFSDIGYTATSMRDIAFSLNLKAGSLYTHISSKEEVLWEIVSRVADEFEAALLPVSALQAPAPQQFGAALEAYIQVITRNQGFAKVLFTEWRHLPPERQAQITERRDRVERFFREVLRRGVAEGLFRADLDVRLAAVLALSGANWLPNWYSAAGPLSPEAVAQQFAQLLLSGLQPPPLPPTRPGS